MKHVVIVGAGFVGLNAAKILAGKKEIDVTIIDKNNYHLFQPLLYQVATAGLNPSEIAVPVRSIFSKFNNVKVLQGEVVSIHPKEKYLRANIGKFSYDYLIVACGAIPYYYGNEKWATNAPGLKTIEQALEIRRKILAAFENAESEHDKDKKETHLTFIIVGGGSTGVELAGAIAEIGRFTLAKDFKNIDPKSARIIIIEAGSRILSAFSEKLSKKAADVLKKLGVSIWTQKRVTHVDEKGVVVDGARIHASTVLWSAGIKGSDLNVHLSKELDSFQRILVQPDLSLKNYPEVFVAGDQAHTEGEDNKSLPALAPVALQQGQCIAKNIIREIRGKNRKPFTYIDKGQLATIGRRSAILEIGRLSLSGFMAWLVWLLVHIYYLIGFKNKLFVLMQWTSAYITFKKGARLIVNKY
jgi:NADH dehydrogenase